MIGERRKEKRRRPFRISFFLYNSLLLYEAWNDS
jgi:hypothetical protein